MLDLESEVMRGLGSIPTGGNIFHWNFLFSHSQASAANTILALLPTLFNYEKTRAEHQCWPVLLHSIVDLDD